MIKIACLTLIFVGVSYVGVAVGKTYVKKEKFFNEVLTFLNVLANNIQFNKSKLSNVIDENIDNFKTEFKQVLVDYKTGKSSSVGFLTEYENQKVLEFLNSIGFFDVCGELNNIERYNQIFNRLYNESVLNNKKYGELYSKLGIMLGLIVVIIFV